VCAPCRLVWVAGPMPERVCCRWDVADSSAGPVEDAARAYWAGVLVLSPHLRCGAGVQGCSGLLGGMSVQSAALHVVCVLPQSVGKSRRFPRRSVLLVLHQICIRAAFKVLHDLGRDWWVVHCPDVDYSAVGGIAFQDEIAVGV
jgi:hypothetical protein